METELGGIHIYCKYVGVGDQVSPGSKKSLFFEGSSRSMIEKNI